MEVWHWLGFIKTMHVPRIAGQCLVFMVQIITLLQITILSFIVWLFCEPVQIAQIVKERLLVRNRPSKLHKLLNHNYISFFFYQPLHLVFSIFLLIILLASYWKHFLLNIRLFNFIIFFLILILTFISLTLLLLR